METLVGRAVDLAAGIPSTHIRREGIGWVVSRFQHVTYKGKRGGDSGRRQNHSVTREELMTAHKRFEISDLLG